MIYLPRRAVFIHIPRTGGNSITSAIACSCVGQNIDITLGTQSVIRPFTRTSRHIRACKLKRYIEEWDDIFKFAVYRPDKERLTSAIRLVKRDIENKIYLDKDTCGPGWAEILQKPNPEGFIRSRWKEHTTDWFVKGEKGEDLGVVLYPFNKLETAWTEICERCNIPYCSLPHLNSG